MRTTVTIENDADYRYWSLIRLEVEFECEPYEPATYWEPDAGGGIEWWELTIEDVVLANGLPIELWTWQKEELKKLLETSKTFREQIEEACYRAAARSERDEAYERAEWFLED